MKREYERKLFPDADFDEDEDVDEEEVEERESETWLDDVKALTMAPAIDRDALERQAFALTNVLKVGFPSVLEALQFGFGRGRRLKHRTALSHGIPHADRKQRHVALGHQHRMHPDISVFPRERFYRGDRLKDAQGMADKRPFLQGPRSRWLDVPDGTEDGQVKRNKREAEAILNELRRLNDDLSAAEPSLSKRRWSVAVLTFYRAQERLLLDTLRRGQGSQGPRQPGFQARPLGHRSLHRGPFPGSRGGRRASLVRAHLCPRFPRQPQPAERRHHPRPIHDDVWTVGRLAQDGQTRRSACRGFGQAPRTHPVHRHGQETKEAMT